jgi:hypothetical protein
MLFVEITVVYSESQTKPINTLCAQNAELLQVKVCGSNKNHCVLDSKANLVDFKSDVYSTEEPFLTV